MVGHEYFKLFVLRTILAMANIQLFLTALTYHYRYLHAETLCIVLHLVVEMPPLSERRAK